VFQGANLISSHWRIFVSKACGIGQGGAGAASQTALLLLIATQNDEAMPNTSLERTRER
jgi:hypothetical protein